MKDLQLINSLKNIDSYKEYIKSLPTISNNDLASKTDNSRSEWLTTIQAAEYLKISCKTLYNLTSNGKIKYFKFGRRNRYRIVDLNNILLANSRGEYYGNKI